MATSELSLPRSIARESAQPRAQISAIEYAATQAMAALASLRLTVGLFAAAIFLIFVGTLAQKDHDVWYVVDHTYFRVWFARVDFLVFERLVQIFSKGTEWNLSGGFYFPGGKLIGLFLLLNLAAAHSVRFKIAAEGRRLAIGLAAIAAGLVITYLVIQSGMNDAVESELSPAFCDLLWQFFRGLLAVTTLAGTYAVLFLRNRMRSFEWGVLLVVDVLLAVLTVWLLANPEVRLDNSGLRILWQLVKGTAAGIVLLAGCILVFRKRAGIVLLHGGIGLMMLSEMLTGIQAQESHMTIAEGATVNYSADSRTSELAVIDRSHQGHDHVTVVPASILQSNVEESQPIEHSDLPFKVKVHRWLPNADVRAVKAGDSNAATAGFGLQETAVPLRQATGVGEDAEKVDAPAAYVDVLSKTDGKSLGTFLVHALWKDQPVEVDGQTYDVALRFKRIYHPYSITLKDFENEYYTGTNTAKNYSSLVVLKDPERNVDRELSIWMNNPLRYAGTTLYQSSFNEVRDPVTKAVVQQHTILQVVKNPSWMAPYVACMLVATGMLAHFGTILVRFLRRRMEQENAAAMADSRVGTAHQLQGDAKRAVYRKMTGSARPTSGWATFGKWFPALVVVIFAGYVFRQARVPEAKPSEMQIYEFSKLPVAFQGRIKPYDTLARNTLQILSGKQELSVWSSGKVTEKLPAIRWLLDAISDHPRANDHRVFRIENLDVLDTLGLEHRPQFWKYSLNEIHKKKGVLDRQIDLARAIPEGERSLYQHKVLDLAGKRNFYSLIATSFRSPPISTNQDELEQSLRQTQFIIGQLREGQAPHAIPPRDASNAWTPLLEANWELIRDHVTNQPLNQATVALSKLLSAYARDDAATFNKQLAEYRRVLADYEKSLNANVGTLKASGVANAEIFSRPKVDFEVFYNWFSPFYFAAFLYVVAFLLGVFSWMGWTPSLRRASMWLLWFTFALHTFALVARIYISGRPPVTNLYSTAIFIGWGGVLLCLMFESIYRLGLGNIAAAVIGFLTLLVAYNLSLDGDTFIVLQAVLDTQFWLATHVVTINFGYAATYVAGVFGAAYILAAHVFPLLDEEGRHILGRIVYGTLCFAIFFSFVGTVLGGLWADDSWGRFWGWDPKENGALMIVLWNALVLHARWGGLVKARGLATLAVGGNIVTTWSYFGVNELGVGLHSYGASEKNTAMWLLIFAASQLALIALGMMPRRWFESLSLSSAKSTAE